MTEIWASLIDPKNAPTLGALGFLLSLFGFPITIWQLLRTRKAADAASLAANNAKLRMNSFSALRECENARSYSHAVNDAISKEDWDGVLMNYQNIARSLNELLLCNVNFDVDVSLALATGIDVVENNCTVLEKTLKADPAKLTKGKQFSALRKVDPSISKALFNLERLAS